MTKCAWSLTPSGLTAICLTIGNQRQYNVTNSFCSLRKLAPGSRATMAMVSGVHQDTNTPRHQLHSLINFTKTLRHHLITSPHLSYPTNRRVAACLDAQRAVELFSSGWARKRLMMSETTVTLREIRERLAYSQSALGALAEVAPRTILRIETAQVAPRPITRRRLARALNLEPWQILWPTEKVQEGAN